MSKTKNPDMDLFARVVDGEVKEYPVRRLHIQNRAQPISWYTPVVQLEKPEVQPFHYLKEVLTVGTASVTASYVSVPYTLAELLSQLAVPVAGPGEEQQPPKTISGVDPALVQHIYKLVGDYVTEVISNFAKTRNYGNDKVDPFVSLSTYANSSFPKFKAEAERVFQIRDQAWINLIGYMEKVLAGTIPLPTSLSTIDQLIPALKWPDEDTQAAAE